MEDLKEQMTQLKKSVFHLRLVVILIIGAMFSTYFQMILSSVTIQNYYQQSLEGNHKQNEILREYLEKTKHIEQHINEMVENGSECNQQNR